jgi:putative transposase
MRGDEMTIDNEPIDNLLKDYKRPEGLIGDNGLLKELTKRLLGAGDGR